MLVKLTWCHSGIISCVDLLKITVKYPSLTVIFPCFRCQFSVIPACSRGSSCGRDAVFYRFLAPSYLDHRDIS